MEQLKNNKEFNVLKWIFIIISLIHVLYATFTMRGMYEDGGFNMLSLLDNFANNRNNLIYDSGHPRFFILFLFQFPVMFCHWVCPILEKSALVKIYTFTQFALPLLALWWNYKLSKRTNRSDIFFWSLFTYSTILITFQIFSVVETLIGATLHFILWNYLVADFDYKKRDIIAILFLVAAMFATYEYVIFLGIIFFIAHFHYVFKIKNLKSKLIKSFIGYSALTASIFNIIFMFNVEGEGEEITRFFKEFHDFIPNMWNMNIMFSFITIFFLALVLYKKQKLHPIFLIIFSSIYIYIFYKLLNITFASVYPMWEQHFRTIPCWFIPMLFTGLYIADWKLKDYTNKINYGNLICIVLLCGILQSCWQMVNTYYWDKNIQYMKSELEKTNSLLYIPTEHQELSGFHNEELRRYIWHGAYAFTSILFSDTYEQKTLLMNYDTSIDEGNSPHREALFVYQNKENKISIPYGVTIDIKNKYWDLTNVAEALDKYNKENNIQTWQ